jgi:hypothetical protein
MTGSVDGSLHSHSTNISMREEKSNSSQYELNVKQPKTNVSNSSTPRREPSFFQKLLFRSNSKEDIRLQHEQVTTSGTKPGSRPLINQNNAGNKSSMKKPDPVGSPTATKKMSSSKTSTPNSHKVTAPSRSCCFLRLVFVKKRHSSSHRSLHSSSSSNNNSTGRGMSVEDRSGSYDDDRTAGHSRLSARNPFPPSSYGAPPPPPMGFYPVPPYYPGYPHPSMLVPQQMSSFPMNHVHPGLPASIAPSPAILPYPSAYDSFYQGAPPLYQVPDYLFPGSSAYCSLVSSSCI